ncbi:hypothetical protein CASFOL_012898 [Castilleja foliolosa]|uniref:Uncharacterized protein n=1 Tax=Castilleja foliolosa TaxID=1961234 RepID=A0ABD3DII6_9LAMI
MAEIGLLFHSNTSIHLHTQHQKAQNPLFNFHRHSICIFNHRLHLLSSSALHISKSRKWDFDAESYNNFSPEETQDFDKSVDNWFDVLEDYVDSIWIFKVFVYYGWALPFILLSLLLTTGPKAFLMALALPIGQSTFTFALQRFQNGGKMKPKLKSKAKMGKSRGYSSRKAKPAEWIGGSKGARKKKKRYHESPVYEDDDVSGSSGGDGSDYGGWDELLDAGVESKIE